MAVLAAILVAALVPAASASADSATIAVVDAGGGKMHVIADVTSTACSEGGYCGWFSFAVERHSALPCGDDEAFLMGVHPGLESAGTVHEEWDYEPFFPRQDKICVFVYNGLGAHPVGEAVISLPAGYGRQRSSAHNCSYFSSQRRAEYYLELYPSDPSRLDADHDGAACEANPCPCGAEPIPPEPEPAPPAPPAPVVIPPSPAPPAPSAECVLAREKRSYWQHQVSKDNSEVRYSYRARERQLWTHRRKVAEAAWRRAKTWAATACV